MRTRNEKNLAAERIANDKLKVNISDIVNDDTTGGTDVPASAEIVKMHGTSISELTAKLKGEFLKRLYAGTITKIKLIGDSVTASLKVTGYALGNSRLIINRSGNQYEVITDATTFASWGNLFRKFVTAKSPTTDFFNAGVGGLSTAEVASTYLSTLITDTEDVLFIMLGMNDRTGTFAAYEANMRAIINYALSRSKMIILMSYPPSTSEFTNNDPSQSFTTGYNFGSKEIHLLMSKLADEFGLIFIPHYVASTEYLAKANMEYHSLVDVQNGINHDYTHPTNRGDRVMWETIQDQLGFVGDIAEWDFGYNKIFMAASYDRVGLTTALTSSLFKDRCISYDFIATANSEGGGTPGNSAGTLITYKGLSALVGWGYQEYSTYQSSVKYMRTWSGVWSDWKRISQSIHYSTADRQALPWSGLSRGDEIFDRTLNKPVYLITRGNGECDTLTITAGATTSGNITITLNGVDKVIAVAAGDTIAQVETKIRAQTYTGWWKANAATSGIIVFTKIMGGTCTAPVFTDTGTTGVVVSFVRTITGTANVWQDAVGNSVT